MYVNSITLVLVLAAAAAAAAAPVVAMAVRTLLTELTEVSARY